MTWIPLHVHSQYSILDSTISLPALIERAKGLEIPAIALTDQGNLYGLVDFYKSCKGAGIRPILGAALSVAFGSRLDKKKLPGMPSGCTILLLAKNITGYRNLCKLSSLGFLEGFYYYPRIDKEILAQFHEGLICLSGSVDGPLGFHFLQGHEPDFLAEVEWYHSLFKEDFYFEIQRSKVHPEEYQEEWLLQKAEQFVANQARLNARLIELSQSLQIPIVATNKIQYIERSDWQAHEILLNIQSGEPCEIWERDSQGNPKTKSLNPKRETAATHDFDFKSPQEMEVLFADLPQALEETKRIADKCVCSLDLHTKLYPVFVPPGFQGAPEERLEAVEVFLKDLCITNIDVRYKQEQLAHVALKYPGKNPRDVVLERFHYEFHILTSKGMCDYMLIVYDFINWAKRHHIPMGPGRGSAAGSIISYLIGITDIEPLRFHLFFERFINPERISYPDIDVDICMERRQEVIDYVIAKYGKDKVAQIITFGTMKAKMAIRDVGRVLNVPLSKVNQIAALVPEDPQMTLEKALAMDPELVKLCQEDEEAGRVLLMARKAEGSIRNTSTHAAGLIISADPITDHVPVCTAKDSAMVVTQYAMKPVESVGMLKIDFLGLKTLTCIQKCTDAIQKRYQKKIGWETLPLDDPETFILLNQGRTLGVFQLESGGMQDLAKQLHIDTFEEIIAVGALYRPGPMDMIPSFIQRKHKKEAIEMEHPLMETILSETYGVMVYQEQVMQIASALAGYTLGEGDVLRRAMGKKDKEEMSNQRKKFVEGCQQNGIDAEIGIAVFDKIEKFASYGFNKSHAAAYAYLSYATAYFKANYPSEWMAALMTCDRDDITKVAKFIGEAKLMQIPVLPPDINQAGSVFIATQEGIRFAMSGIKGVGELVVSFILEEREKNGPYASLYQFIQRMDKTKVGKKQIELLCESGGFDFTGWGRDELLGSVEEMFSQALKEQKELSAGILDLFSQMTIAEPPFLTPPTGIQKRSPLTILHREKELLGVYLTGHPMDAYKPFLGRLSCVPLKDLSKLSSGVLFRAAFIVEAVQVKVFAKNQRKFAILTISDGDERFEVPIWPEMYEDKGDLLKENQLLYAVLSIDAKEGSIQLTCKDLQDLTTFDEETIKRVEMQFDQLKMQTKSFESKKNLIAKEKPAPTQEETAQFYLSLDADRIQMSQILKLKELFREFPGSSPIELEFFSQGQSIGVVKIGAEWGVKTGRALEERLQAMAAEFRVQVVKKTI